MADSFIQVAPDNPLGKKLQTALNTISGEDVHAEAVVLVDQFGVLLTIIPPGGFGQLGGLGVCLLDGAGRQIGSNPSSNSLNVEVTQPVFLAMERAEAQPHFLGDSGLPAMAIRKATPADISGDDTYGFLQMDGGKLWVRGPLTDAELRATPVPISGSFSLPTGAATEAKQDTQITDLGGVTETAPATDTASSGLNGRLQRIAQRITSFIALLPASLGQKTKANSFAVTLASDSDTLPVSAASLPLPTGAATEATLATRAAAATQTDGTQRTKITDGTNNAAVKAASTAAIATDPALVVAISPNNPIAITVGEIEIKNDSGNPVPISAASLPLPTGAATETTEAAILAKIIAAPATEAKQDTQITDLGGVTETAPATDTASSGLNGRLQRIAQRLTSLIALLPSSLGQKTKANSLAVTLASDEDILTALGGVNAGAVADGDIGSINAHLRGLGLQTGPVTETAPATDTASSGLNGRLQRIAQRITSLITALGSPFQAGGSIGNTTFASTQSGTWTVQPGNTANTTAWKVDGSAVTQPVSAASLPLPTGASTAAKQPALGTALTPSADVLTTQRPAITQVVSTAFEASKVLKSSAGQLVQLSVFNSGPAQFILLMNSTTVPANGAVTLLFPPIPIAAATLLVLDLPAPLVASTGIAVCNSTTGTFTKTIGAANCAFYAQVN